MVSKNFSLLTSHSTLKWMMGKRKFVSKYVKRTIMRLETSLTYLNHHQNDEGGWKYSINKLRLEGERRAHGNTKGLGIILSFEGELQSACLD